MKRIFFFAAPSDIRPVLTRFEERAPLKFVEMGNRTTQDRAVYVASSDIPHPGIATHETGIASRSYMVSRREAKNYVHEFVGKRGERRWSLDNGDNDEATVLTMAGLWQAGTLLPGLMDTLHETPAAQ